MPNPQGNPEFKSKYGEKTKVIRLPESIADSITLLLSQGCASSDILEQLQPLSQDKLSNLAETDSTLIHLPVELRLLRAIKDVAKQEDTHYLEWIVNQCKKGLNLSPTSPAVSSEQLTTLIDKRFDNLVTNLLDSLQAQLAAFDSRLAQLEHQPLVPSIPPESTTTTAIASPTPDPKPTTSQSTKSAKSTKSTPPTSQQQIPSTDKAQQQSDSSPSSLSSPSSPSSPVKLPSIFPSDGLASLDLAKLLHRHQATINAHRRTGNGLLSGWQHQKVKGLSGWRYFPTTPQALNLWKDAIKSGLLNPASVASS